jgi:hypothetical protein
MPVARRQRRIFQDCRTGYLSRGEENFTASIKEICHSPKQEQKQAFATVGQRFECPVPRFLAEGCFSWRNYKASILFHFY